MRMLLWNDLRDKGIPFSKMHIYRLVRRGLFPPPAKVGINTPAWPEDEIDAYLRQCITDRDETRRAPPAHQPGAASMRRRPRQGAKTARQVTAAEVTP